ncbi:hypothetical protein EWM64_g4316 [Hericium alpestre]|uniref:Uncharacterized protein n=1 Tax=Hericium alpestre TaxID=135208 RepID=A0A4Y9ZYW0_9AGAM|nr:hypothetical protein EWM64_g4316 [Hericium alpestre]
MPAASVEPHLEPSSSIEISFALRIDQSKLCLTCQPDVNVLAGIYWNSGGFVINISPGARQMSFMGNVGGLSIGIKHGFLSEDCIRLDARDLVFAVTFTKMAQDQERSVGSVSIVLDTEVSGGVHFSRLQDVLCFKAVWLDHIPILNGTSAASFVQPDTTSLAPSANIPKQTLVNALLVRVRRVELDVDLGQSISAVKLDLQNVSFRTKLGEVSDELYFSIVDFHVDAIGNISGKAHVPNFAFQSHRRKDILASSVVLSSAPVTMLDLSMTSGTIYIRVDSDYQRILQICAGPLHVVVFDDWSELSSGIMKSNQHLRLSFSVSGSNLTAILTVGTIPKLVSYVSKFKSNLDIQREGASRESQAFRVARSPNPGNPLSSVAQAMIQSARARLREPEAPLTYVIRQEMRMSLQSIRLVVFPRTMLDIEVAHFAARDVRAQLDRILRSESLPVQRTLHLAFASMTTSKYSQLNQSSMQPSFDQGFEEKSGLNDLLQNASEAIIFDLPSMDMLMKSEEMGKESGTVLKYDFISRFVRREGLKDQEDIYITLNVSLYSWLTILRKNLTRELNQVQGGMDRRHVVATAATSLTSRKKASDSLYAELTPDVVSGVQSRPDTPPDRGSLSAHVYPSSTSNEVVLESMDASNSLDPVAVPPVLSSDTEEHNFGQPSAVHDAQPPIASTSSTSSANGPPKPLGIVYQAGERRIERLNMRQLGEATPDVMHPFFMKKAGFSLEDSLPQYIHEYATLPIDEITRLLLNLYSKQLRDDHT